MPPDFGWSAASAAPQIAGKHKIAGATPRTPNMLSSLDNFRSVPGATLTDWRRRYRGQGGEATPGASCCIGNWDDGNGNFRCINAARAHPSHGPNHIESEGSKAFAAQQRVVQKDERYT